MKKNRLTQFLETLIKRTGGWYFLVIVAIAQLVAIPGAIIGALTIQLNADFSPLQMQVNGTITAISVLLSNLILLVAAWLLTPNARARLNTWSKGNTLETGTHAELNAWRESTAFAWRYGVIAAIVSVAIGVLPGLLYQWQFMGASYDQSVYLFFGGSILTIGTVIIAVIAIERMLEPARGVLAPKKFEDQLNGSSGLPILSKFVVVVLAIIVFTVLLIAPVGYRQTVRSITYEVDSRQALAELRLQSLALSGAALVLGSLLAWLISRSVSQPIHSLIKVFEKIETGDLSQRAPILSTDEVGELSVHFNRMVARLEELQGNLENQVKQRTAQLQATNEVGQIASAILDESKLASEVVNLIVSRFDYYHAAIFLVDSTGFWAELKEATGKAGQTLRAQRYRLQVAGRSMVGQAISTRQPRITLDVGMESYRMDNPLLPDTRSEIALPLIVRDQVLGALDVQSREPNAFKEEDIETLQGMANQVAIALENARLFQETRENLEELRAIHQHYVASAWVEKMRSSKVEAVAELPGTPQNAENLHTVSVPLVLRDQKLGEIVLESDIEWGSEEENMLQAMAMQVAVSLENARLIEESQQSALRERLAAEITEKIWLSTSMDGILQTAIREIGRSLEASDAIIQLNLNDSHGQQ